MVLMRWIRYVVPSSMWSLLKGSPFPTWYLLLICTKKDPGQRETVGHTDRNHQPQTCMSPKQSGYSPKPLSFRAVPARDCLEMMAAIRAGWKWSLQQRTESRQDCPTKCLTWGQSVNVLLSLGVEYWIPYRPVQTRRTCSKFCLSRASPTYARPTSMMSSL